MTYKLSGSSKLIKAFEINIDDLSALKEIRSFEVKGDIDAVFSLQVKTSANKFYNFVTKEFVTEANVTSDCRLANQVMISRSYHGKITFPADADGETYTILLNAEPHFKTEIAESLIGFNANKTDLAFNPILFQANIIQVADVVLSFAPIAATTANYTSATLAQRLHITKSPTTSTPVTGTISWTIANDAEDAVAFGLIPVLELTRVSNDAALGSSRAVEDSNWYAETTAVINDDKSSGGSTHTNYFVDNISDLSTGMIVTAISSGTLGTPPTLAKINLSPNAQPINKGRPQIKLNSAKAFADGITLTLKGYNINVVNRALGCDVTLSNFKLTQNPIQRTVRGAVSDSANITLNGTYGISKGAFIEGFGVDNSVSNPITEVTTSSEATGTIVVTRNQTLTANTVLNIIGSSDSYTVTGDVTVNKVPTSNKTIYLDLDKILTLGTAS